MASFDKPLIVNVKGLLKNGSLGLFLQTPFVFCDKETTFQVNDLDYGMIPNCGSLYFLSNLSYNIGLFMALTGAPANSDDLYELNCIDQVKNITESDIITLKKLGHRFYPFIKYNSQDYINQESNILETCLDKRLADEFYQRGFVNDKKENLNMLLKDMLYKRKIIHNANMENKFNWKKSYYDFEHNYTTKSIENNLYSYEIDVLTYIKDEHYNDKSYSLYNYKDKISHHFSFDTVDKIIESLEEENSDWSRGVADILSNKDKGLLQLTIDAFIKARNLDYVSSLKLESAINMDIMSSTTFLNKLEAKFNHKNIDTVINEYKDIDYYCNLSKNIKLDFEDYSLLPTREYFREYPEAVRLFLNQKSSYNIDLLENYDKIIKRVLFKHGIDVQTPSFEIKEITKGLFDKKKLDKYLNKRSSISKELITSEEKLKQYLDKRTSLIDSIESKELHCITNEIISKIYKNAVIQNEKNIADNSKEISDFIKNKNYDNLKKYLVNNRLIVDQNDYNYVNFAGSDFLPIEINSHIFKLSGEMYDDMQMDAIKNNFLLKKKYSKQDLNSYLLGHLNIKNSFGIEKSDNSDVIYDKNKINNCENYVEDSAKLKKKIHYFFKVGKFEPEIVFQKKMVSELVNILKEEKIVFENNEREIYDEIYNELFAISDDYNEMATGKGSLGQLRSNLIKLNYQTNDEEINYNNNILKISNAINSHINNYQANIIASNTITNNNEEDYAIDISSLLITDILEHEFNSKYKSEYNQIFNTFLNYIKNNNTLIYNKLEDILSSKSGILFELKKIFVSLFLNKVHKINKNIELKLAVQSDNNAINIFNNFIKKNMYYEYFEYISSHLYFNFSLFGLKYIENKLNSVKFNINQQNYIKLLLANNIITDKNNYKLELHTIDNSILSLIKVYDIYKEKLIFKDDILLNQLVQIDNNNKSMYKKDLLFKYLLEINDMELSLEDENIKLDFKTTDTKSLKNYDDVKILESGSFTNIISLESDLKKIKENNLSNMDEYYSEISKLDLNIPQYFNNLDYRQPAIEWLKDRVEEFASEILQKRKNIEKELNNSELIKLDNQIGYLLSPNNLKKVLTSRLYNDINNLKISCNIETVNAEDLNDKINQADLTSSCTNNILKNVKNEKSLRKLVAFNIINNMSNNDDDEETVLKNNIIYERLFNEISDGKLEEAEVTDDNSKIGKNNLTNKNELLASNNDKYIKLFLENMTSDKELNIAKNIKNELSDYLNIIKNYN